MALDISENLKDYGLSTKEARVYLACLKIGPASISDIAKTAGLKRPTVYIIIDSLIEKRLIHKVPKEKRIFYRAESPRKLTLVLRERLSKIESVMPELQALFRASPRQPKIRFYEGKKGVWTIYEEIFSSSRNIIAAVSLEKFFQVYTEKDNAYLFRLLRESGGRINDLLERSKNAEKYVKTNYRKGLGRTKFLPEDFELTTDVLVYGNKVAMISFINLMGIIIENEEIAQTQRRFLKFLWDNV